MSIPEGFSGVHSTEADTMFNMLRFAGVECYKLDEYTVVFRLANKPWGSEEYES